MWLCELPPAIPEIPAGDSFIIASCTAAYNTDGDSGTKIPKVIMIILRHG